MRIVIVLFALAAALAVHTLTSRSVRAPPAASVRAAAPARTPVGHAGRDPARLVERSPFCSSCERALPSPSPPPSGPPAFQPEGFTLLATQLAIGRGESAAILRAQGRTTLVRVGAAVPGGATVDAIEATAIVLVSGPARFRLSLLPDGTPLPPGGTPLPPLPPQASPAAPADDLAAGIRELSPTSRRIDAAMLKRVTDDPSILARQAVVLPSPDGMHFRYVRAGSLVARLGLQAGDRLQTLNGVDVRDPAILLDQYFKLRGAARIDLGIRRGDAIVTLSYAIE